MAAIPENNLVAGTKRRIHVWSPSVDFALLGGGGAIIVALTWWLWPANLETSGLLTWTLVLANVVNHPHFAHSYQLFYRQFTPRAFGSEFPPALRVRYIIAAIGIPILLAAFFGYCIWATDAALLGLAANAMFALVGWHYVKQGYGMLMVDAALKQNFFNADEKQRLLFNAYACWANSWLLINHTLSDHNYWGLAYYAVSVPPWIITAVSAITIVTSARITMPLLRKLSLSRRNHRLISGTSAYVTSLYLWLLIRHPAVILIVPALHSLQYLAVVWRYRWNMEKCRQGTGLLKDTRPWQRFALFLTSGIALGYMGFWAAPSWLGANVPYNKDIFGGTLFVFIFWIFINIHHYFLDNVMWRKDNPDTRRYLFDQ